MSFIWKQLPIALFSLNSRGVGLMGGQLHPKDGGQWLSVTMNFSGVPQGSVMGPVLFSVLVNGIEGLSAPSVNLKVTPS